MGAAINSGETRPTATESGEGEGWEEGRDPPTAEVGTGSGTKPR